MTGPYVSGITRKVPMQSKHKSEYKGRKTSDNRYTKAYTVCKAAIVIFIVT